MLETSLDAYQLLESLGANQKLLLHHELVGEAADELIRAVMDYGVDFDDKLVRLGAAVHDAGKILHPEEQFGKGSQHEPAGEKLLLENSVQAEVARCCVSHARYADIPVSFEELLVALSDKLWKGKRVEELELLVIDTIAKKLNTERWDVFATLDSEFETIASKGDERLARSAGI